jgi:hypothetical protein
VLSGVRGPFVFLLATKNLLESRCRYFKAALKSFLLSPAKLELDGASRTSGAVANQNIVQHLSFQFFLLKLLLIFIGNNCLSNQDVLPNEDQSVTRCRGVRKGPRAMILHLFLLLISIPSATSQGNIACF